jgi:inosine/xanthosine triphosphatase
MSKIYVGTTNHVKIAAVKKVAKEYEVVGLEVDSGVSKQPFSDQETIQGATNRALALPQDGLRIGLEAGVQPLNGELYLVNWGVLIDEDHHVYVAGGTRLPLPTPVARALELRTDELATIIDHLYQTSDIKHHEGAIGILTNGLVHRIDIFEHIVKLLLGQYQVKNGGMN